MGFISLMGAYKFWYRKVAIYWLRELTESIYIDFYDNCNLPNLFIYLFYCNNWASLHIDVASLFKYLSDYIFISLSMFDLWNVNCRHEIIQSNQTNSLLYCSSQHRQIQGLILYCTNSVHTGFFWFNKSL